MKKHTLLIPIMAALLLVLPGSSQQPEGEKPLFFESNFYPLKPGTQWHYRTASAKGTSQKVHVSVEKQDALKVVRAAAKDAKDKKDESLSVLCARLKIVSSDKVLHEHVAVLEDGVYRFTSAGKDITPPLRFFKLPLTKGETWEVNSISEGVPLKGVFTSEEAVITVPAGKFSTMVASCKEFQIGAQKMEVEYWFAQKVGIVKQRVVVGNFDVVLELEKFEAGK